MGEYVKPPKEQKLMDAVYDSKFSLLLCARNEGPDSPNLRGWAAKYKESWDKLYEYRHPPKEDKK